MPVTINVDGLAEGTYNYTIIVSDGLGGLVQDTIMVHVKADVIPLAVGIVIVAIAIVGIIVLRLKYKAIANQVRSKWKSAVTKRQAPGTVEEVMYRRPKYEPLVQEPATHPVTSENPAAFTCRSCGQPMPKGGEKVKFCIYCGKSMA
jgi:hypothetical protein